MGVFRCVELNYEVRLLAPVLVLALEPAYLPLLLLPPICLALTHQQPDQAVDLGMGVSLCWEHAYVVRLCARALVLALWAAHCTPPPLSPILASTPHPHGL